MSRCLIVAMALVLLGPAAASVQQDRLGKLEQRVAALEKQSADDSSGWPQVVLMVLMCGALAALCGGLRQTNGRDSWTWFLSGVLFNIFTPIVLWNYIEDDKNVLPRDREGGRAASGCLRGDLRTGGAMRIDDADVRDLGLDLEHTAGSTELRLPSAIGGGRGGARLLRAGRAVARGLPGEGRMGRAGAVDRGDGGRGGGRGRGGGAAPRRLAAGGGTGRSSGSPRAG